MISLLAKYKTVGDKAAERFIDQFLGLFTVALTNGRRTKGKFPALDLQEGQVARLLDMAVAYVELRSKIILLVFQVIVVHRVERLDFN